MGEKDEDSCQTIRSCANLHSFWRRKGGARVLYRFARFTEIEKPEALKANGGLWYRVGDIELHIGVENRDGYNSKSHPAFEVENIDEVRRYLEENGVPTKDEKPIPGVKRFSFRDPFHNRIEFLSKR